MTDDWIFLKEKCVKCYELNRYREIRNSVGAYLTDEIPILQLRYCEEHQKAIDDIMKLISSRTKENES